MIPAFRDDELEVRLGDVRLVLAELPDASVDAIVTSPPYWQQRSYLPDDDPEKGFEIGLEPRLVDWVETIVSLCRSFRRVLKPTGSLWLNLGDKYVANGGKRSAPKPAEDGRTALTRAYARRVEVRESLAKKQEGVFGAAWTLGWPEGVKRKSLTLAPYRVALALTDREGWILRDEVVWHKKNGVPDSTPNRFGRKHEILFRFTTSREDYFDLAAVRTRYAASTLERVNRGPQSFGGEKGRRNVHTTARPRSGKPFELADGANPGDVWAIATAAREGSKSDHVAPFPPELVVRPILSTVPPGGVVLDPFAGSGTVGVVANTLGRRAILVDLDRRNLPEILRRTVRELDYYALGLVDAPAEIPTVDQAELFEAEA